MSESGLEATSQPGYDDVFPRPLDKAGLFVAGIVHNLYSPLTAMLGTLDLMRMKHPELQKELERISKMTYRLKDDIAVIMEKARLEGATHIVELNLAELITNELLFYKGDPRLKHMIEVTWEEPPDIPVFNAPSRDFTMTFDQLLTNAIEAMEESDTKKLMILLFQQDDELILTMKDTGIGMDQETLDRAFEPFFTTKTARKEGRNPPTLALGVGLTFAKLLMDNLGCSLQLESQPGEGTLVELRIPWKQIHEAHPKPVMIK